MAAGFDLKHGEYKKGSLSDDEMWSAYAYLFSTKSVNDTSYKFGFLIWVFNKFIFYHLFLRF